jgi:thioredoxin-related protein
MFVPVVGVHDPFGIVAVHWRLRCCIRGLSKERSMFFRTLAASAALALSGMACSALAQQPDAPAVAPAKPVRSDKPKIYDEKADVKAQIAAAVSKAKKENQRVLVQWGGNWCGWCTLLHECMTKDRDIAKLVMYEYVVVNADAGVPDGKNVDLASGYGADLKKHGFPYLTILDGEGKVIANQDTGSLEVPGQQKHDDAKVLAFLKQHVAPQQDASAVLESARSAAQSSGRMVFVHFGAPWCGWCHRLEDWMAKPDVAPLLAKDFVDCTIDIDRMKGGNDVLAKFRPSKDGGIPWFVIIDAAGKPLITSDGPKGNVGFPASPEEIAHFESMLSKTARKLSKEEQAVLIQSLRDDKKPAAAKPESTGG